MIQQLVKECIKKAGSKAELARKLGVSGPAISKWVEGRFVPSPKNFVKLTKLHDELFTKEKPY
jgi:transcriptional regulator with XRE-family HTH domain